MAIELQPYEVFFSNRIDFFNHLTDIQVRSRNRTHGWVECMEDVGRYLRRVGLKTHSF